jgi:hypothetical protein
LAIADAILGISDFPLQIQTLLKFLVSISEGHPIYTWGSGHGARGTVKDFCVQIYDPLENQLLIHPTQYSQRLDKSPDKLYISD